MSISTILPYGSGPGQWDTIRELLQSAANWNFANGQKMDIKGNVCGNVANASSVQGNGNYTLTGSVGGIQWVGPNGPIHSTYTSQSFDCQWFTDSECPSPNQPSDQLFVDIATASNTAKALTPTQTFTGIDTNGGNFTVTVHSGLNVINVPPNPYGTTEGKLQVRGNGDLIISGPADAVVIFNVGADNEINAVRNGMSIENGRSILLQGGVLAQNVLFNVLGGDLLINGGTVNGNFLVRAGSDVKGKATIQGTTHINGIVIGDGNHSSEFLLDTGASICGAFPMIDVEKEVSPDNGTTWFDADTPPGPNVPSGTNPLFRFTVRNTGTVTLTNVTVTDDVFMSVGTIPSLAPNGTAVFIVSGTWALGQHHDTATATGHFGSQTVTDTDLAYWLGVITPAPAIDVIKEVSPDNGTTWFDANTSPGPNFTVGTTLQYRFTVTNTGNVALTNVTVTDPSFTPSTIIGPISLAVGAHREQVIIDGQVTAGQHHDTATATGQYGTQTVSDTDDVYWFGVTGAVPAIDVKKEVSPDNGTTWFDANTSPGPNFTVGTNLRYRFTVTNTGNVALTDVTVTDLSFTPSTIIGPISLAIGAHQEQVVIDGQVTAGQHHDTATATGHYDSQTVTDTDDVYWFGVPVVTATIDVEKEVSPDNGAHWFDADTPQDAVNVPDGTNPQFRFTVTNTSSVTLSNVIVTDDVYDTVGTVQSLGPGASAQFIVIGTFAVGQHFDTATATGTFDDQHPTDTDKAYWNGLAVPNIAIEKFISVDGGLTWLHANQQPFPTIVVPGIVKYKLVITNTGNVTLTFVSVSDPTLGITTVGGTLEAGQSFEIPAQAVSQLGEHCNMATVSGEYHSEVGVIAVQDDDRACYVGIERSCLDIEKFVSVDGGQTWQDADTPPGPTLLAGNVLKFKFVVTNNCSVTLNDITVTDTVLGPITLEKTTLGSGEHTETVVLG